MRNLNKQLISANTNLNTIRNSIYFKFTSIIKYLSRVVREIFYSLKEKGLRFTINRILSYIYVKSKGGNFPLNIPYKIFIGIKKAYLKINIGLKTFIYTLPRFSGLNKEKRDRKIIVSLTTYPTRIHAVVIVLGILLRQTCKPDKILLYLAKDQFANRKLPILLCLQVICGVEVIYCDDLKPHKKYFYTMQKYPDDIVITVDDDVYYERNLIECLYYSYKKHPNAVSALRTHLITFNEDGQINPYIKWKLGYSGIVDHPSLKLCATGVGGILYPPYCMHKELFNIEKIKSLCLMADDIWIKVMQLMNHTQVVLVPQYKRLRYINGTQENALWHKNINESKNDEQLKDILKEYNEYFGKDDTLLKRLKEGI